MKRIFLLLVLVLITIPVCSASQLTVGTTNEPYVGSTLTVGTTSIPTTGITTAITTAIETLIPEQPIENPIDLNPGVTTSGNSQVILNDGVVTFGGDGVSITTGTVIDGYNFKPSSTVTSGNTLEWQTGEMMWFVVPDPVVKFKYDYNGSVLKETIILKEDRDISFPITIGANSRFEPWDGGYRIISNEREDVFSKTWIQIQKPWGVDATGKYIPMEYRYDGANLNLVYDKTGITYPLTIDPTYYLSSYNSQLKLLLHMNVSPFVDETGKSVGNTGVTISTTTKKYGNASGSFNSASNLSLADSSDWSIGSNNFTLMQWIYPYTYQGRSNQTYGQSDSASTATSRQNRVVTYGYIEFDYVNTTPTIKTLKSPYPALITGQWNQLVMQRAGNTLYMYVNGSLITSVDVSMDTWLDASGKLGVVFT